MYKKGKLLRKAEGSDLMNIAISMGGEKLSFNLFEELRIDEKTINKEITEQPSYYAFLAVLVVKLNKKVIDLEKEVNKLYAELFIDYKKDIDSSTNRPYSNDHVEAFIVSDKDYQKALKKYHEAIQDKNLIEACSKSFEQRADLIKSLNANVRKEKYVN